MEGWGARAKGDNKWKLEPHGVFSINGLEWYGFQVREGGFGAVKLVQFVEKFDHKQAISWLEENYPHLMPVDEQDAKSRSARQNKDKFKEFNPPPAFSTHLKAVENYLINDRKLPADLILELTKTGRIYADEKANCIFLSDMSAEVRSTIGKFNGSVDGADKKHSGFTIPADPEKNRKVIAICEAAIDAISYRAMYPGASVISSNGAGNLAIQYTTTLQAYEHGYEISLALDADTAGDAAAHQLASSLCLRQKLRTAKNLPQEAIDEAIFNGDLRVSDYKVPEGSNGFLRHPPEAWEYEWVYKPKPTTPENKRLPLDYNIHVWEKIEAADLNYLSNVVRIRRHRPLGEKDWNEILKKRINAGLSAEFGAKPITPAPVIAAPTPEVTPPTPQPVINGDRAQTETPRFQRRVHQSSPTIPEPATVTINTTGTQIGARIRTFKTFRS